MIQSLFLPNDCNDDSERLQPAAWSGLIWKGGFFFFFFFFFFLLLCADWEKRAELELMPMVR